MTDPTPTPSDAKLHQAPSSPALERVAALRAGAVDVVRALRGAGHEAYWAGGCVRDRMLGREPKDYDVATSARPETVLGMFARTIPVGVQFGVVRVLLDAPGGGPPFDYEVATFRADLGYSDGRRPDGVVWSGAREDVLRRDFTINGLLYDPLADTVIDHVGGREDLERRIVRAIGDPHARFEEDRLRLLRAVRFASRFGFGVDPATWEAVCAHAAEIGVVSVERTLDELTRILREGDGALGMAMLASSGLIGHALPECPDAERAEARLAAAPSRSPSPLPPSMAWALALWDVHAPAETVPAWGRRLKASTKLSRAVEAIVRDGHALLAWEELRLADRKRLVRKAHWPLALEAARCAASAGQADLPTVTRARGDARGWSHADLHPPRLLDGHALRRRGHAPGPTFKDALLAVETAQLEGRVTTLDDAWEVAEGALLSARGEPAVSAPRSAEGDPALQGVDHRPK